MGLRIFMAQEKEKEKPKTRRVTATITEEQYQYLLGLREAKIPTTVLMRFLLHREMNNPVSLPMGNGAMIMTKEKKPKVMPLLHPRQTETIKMMSKDFASELTKALGEVDDGQDNTSTRTKEKEDNSTQSEVLG